MVFAQGFGPRFLPPPALKASGPRTLIVLVLDETASMQGCRDATISGVNEYVRSQALQPGDCHVILATFNSLKYQVSHVMPASMFSISHLNYQPSGNTPLFDAVGSTILSVAGKVEGFDQILFVIMTDGEENASQLWSVAQVRALISQKTEPPIHLTTKPWQFVFLGANIDAWGYGEALGGATLRRASYLYQATPVGVAAAFNSLTSSTSAYRASKVARTETFWDEAGSTSDSSKGGTA